MGLATNVVRRRGRYWYRVRVPIDLVERAGRVEVWRSLRTTDPAVARQRAGVVSGSIDLLWGRVRVMNLTKDEIDALVVEYFHTLLAGDERQRVEDMPVLDWKADPLSIGVFALTQPGATDAEIDAAIADSGKSVAAVLLDRMNTISHVSSKQALTMNDWQDAEGLADLLLTQEDIKLEKGSQPYRSLCMGILRAMHEATGIMLARSTGDYSAMPKDTLFLRPRSDAASLPRAGVKPSKPAVPRLSELVERFLAERKGITPKFAADYRAAVTAFEQTLTDPSVWPTATRRDVSAFKDLLLKTPTNWTKHYKGKPLPEVVKAAQGSGRPVLAARTINDKYLSLLSTVFTWGVTNGLCVENVAKGIKVDGGGKRKRKDARSPFKLEHLQKIFSAPLFVGCKSERSYAQPGTHLIRDHRYWAPLIALFSGMRLNEIGQLRIEDFCQSDGIAYMHVTDEGDENRSVKSEAGRRVVPFHPELARLGLHAVVENSRSAGEGRLFPMWECGADGYFSSPMSKWFGRFLGSVGLHDSKLVFHSFRHSFIDALRAANVQKSVRAAIVGHEEGDVEGVYGDGYPPKVLLEAIRQVAFKGLELPRT